MSAASMTAVGVEELAFLAPSPLKDSRHTILWYAVCETPMSSNISVLATNSV